MAALIWCPFADEASAADVARQLIAEKLVACANILGAMHSIFTWNGETGEGQECGVLFKTDASRLRQAIARLEEIHPYDTPAIVGWRCDEAGRATQAWLKEVAT